LNGLGGWGLRDGKAHRSMPTTADARELAARRLPNLIFDFIDGGAGYETTIALNQADLRAVRLMPRVLVDVQGEDLGTTFLGRRYNLPFGIAPMGMCDLAWPGTDRAFATEASQRGFPVCVSTASSTSMEEMLRLSDGHAWFQLYVTGSVETAMRFVDRAASAGYENLLLTVDVPKLGKRPRDLRNGFETPFRIKAPQFLDFAMHPRWSIGTLLAGTPRMANFGSGPNTRGYDRNAARAGADWPFLARLRDHWKGKLIIKGVLSPEDAVGIRDAGADAVYVSNHGGRQLDSAPSTISALAAIRAAVGPDYPLLFDGGARSGEDVVKALASGANFVLMGRPFLYAMAADGARGVSSLIDSLTSDVAIALAQVGLKRVIDINEAILASRPVGKSAGGRPILLRGSGAGS
jgi:(S)-mandelate dehydrogenase